MSLFFIALFNLLTVTKRVDFEYCDIKGNVKNPGVYLVNDGEVINDIILKAGGLKKNSYVKNINLSKKVTDEMVIYIMTIDEYEDLTKECPVCECEIPICEIDKTFTSSSATTKENELTTFLLPTPTETTTQITTQITTEVSELKININTATVEDLIKLPGIGEITANKIIEYRETIVFEKIEDILNVKGIGNALFEKIKDYITV